MMKKKRKMRRKEGLEKRKRTEVETRRMRERKKEASRPRVKGEDGLSQCLDDLR